MTINDTQLENSNPKLHLVLGDRELGTSELDDNEIDPIDQREVFDLIRNIRDPEHPLTLEQLNVVDIDNIKVDNLKEKIEVKITPTIPHCSLAALIGLAVKVQLGRCLPQRYKVSVKITPGSHVSEEALNKQLGDKERVAAATENPTLLKTIDNCLVNSIILTPLPSHSSKPQIGCW